MILRTSAKEDLGWRVGQQHGVTMSLSYCSIVG